MNLQNLLFYLTIILSICKAEILMQSQNFKSQCLKQYSPVCGCLEPQDQATCQTYRNKCIANKFTQLITLGVCQQKTNCPVTRPMICTMDYSPVCGYFINCHSKQCKQTFSNGCSACAQNQVEYYIKGECK